MRSPHPFAVNVPKTLAEVRKRSWRDRPWLALACVVLTPALALFLVPWDVLFARHAGPGAFYAILPWPALAAAATVPLVFSAALLTSGILRFWRESGGGRAWKAFPAALSDVLTLRNLRGGGAECEQGAARRFCHNALVFGFALCFAATVVAGAYHHVLGWLAPYPIISAPVLLGTAGGIGMIAGSAGLAWIKAKADPAMDAAPRNYSFLALLFAVAVTGLALLALRETSSHGTASRDAPWLRCGSLRYSCLQQICPCAISNSGAFASRHGEAGRISIKLLTYILIGPFYKTKPILTSRKASWGSRGPTPITPRRRSRGRTSPSPNLCESLFLVRAPGRRPRGRGAARH